MNTKNTEHHRLSKIKKRLFYLGLILLAFIFLSPIPGLFGIMEFINGRYSAAIWNTKAVLVFICIPFIMSRIFSDHDSMFVSAIKIFVILFASVAMTGIFCLYMQPFNMCSWSNDKILFMHKNQSSVHICQRSFGCGATDSSPPVCKIRKSIAITPLFVFYLPVDTNEITVADWTRINE